MKDVTYEATVVNGQICLPAGVHLPESAKILVVVRGQSESLSARVASPRLAHPEQATDFLMNVQEIADAGV